MRYGVVSDRRAGSRCRRAACSWRRPASGGSADRTVGRRSSVRHGSGRCAMRRWRRLANTSCRPDTSPARWRCRARRRTALNRHDTHTHTRRPTVSIRRQPSTMTTRASTTMNINYWTQRTQVRITPRTVVFIATAAAIYSLGTGCAPLLQCLGRLSLPPSVGR